MGTHCGTADCILVSRDWTALTLDGTTSYASDYVTAASEWVDANIADWHAPVSPLTSGGSVYDYWIKRATANYAVYMAFDSVENDKYPSGEDRYWDRYRDEAITIMGDLRKRWSTMTEDTAAWERGIAPAMGAANGTISAPYVGIMVSNAEYGGIYTGEIARTAQVRLDGTGTTVHDQSFSWGWKGETAFEQTLTTIQPDTWHGLGYGVSVCFLTQADGTLANGQTWEIPCFPSRGGNYGGKGVKSWDMHIG